MKCRSGLLFGSLDASLWKRKANRQISRTPEAKSAGARPRTIEVNSLKSRGGSNARSSSDELFPRRTRFDFRIGGVLRSGGRGSRQGAGGHQIRSLDHAKRTIAPEKESAAQGPQLRYRDQARSSPNKGRRRACAPPPPRFALDSRRSLIELQRLLKRRTPQLGQAARGERGRSRSLAGPVSACVALG